MWFVDLWCILLFLDTYQHNSPSIVQCLTHSIFMSNSSVIRLFLLVWFVWISFQVHSTCRHIRFNNIDINNQCLGLCVMWSYLKHWLNTLSSTSNYLELFNRFCWTEGSSILIDEDKTGLTYLTLCQNGTFNNLFMSIVLKFKGMRNFIL